MSLSSVPLATTDTGGSGDLVVLLPSAGSVRSEHRFLSARLARAGYRAVSADLPGHGSSPIATTYGVAECAAAVIDLVERLAAGPAVVIGASFSPAAAVWAATESPALVRGVVALSPHFERDDSIKGRMQNGLISLLLRGPVAAPAWRGLYRSWHKTAPPSDLNAELGRLTAMLNEPARRRAVRDTLTAHREGVAERMDALGAPALVVFGSMDDHFPDPEAEAQRVASRLRAEHLLVDGAGHYPHVEFPDITSEAILTFLGRLPY